PCCDDWLGLMRYRAWKALSYENEAGLSAGVTEALWKRPLTASVSQLESVAACPFKHFVQYGLRLEQREEEDPTAIDLGNVYHETLEKLVGTILKQKLSWKELPEGRARELIQNCARDVGASLRGELMMSNGRNRHLLKCVE